MVDHSKEEEIASTVAEDAPIYDTDEEIKEALDKGIIGAHDMIKYHADGRVVICEPIDALGHSFSDINQAILAYENKEISPEN